MYFATVLDKNYISRARLMIDSLKFNLGGELTSVFVLCLDEDVHKYFSKISNTTPIRLSILENQYPDLSIAKRNRTYVEYIFTLSPFIPHYILTKYYEVNRITTLDSDLFFFDNPSSIINELGDDNIGITPHDFPVDLLHLEKYGKFNVSFQSFPNNKEGLNCLKTWGGNCIAYCGDYIDEQGRFADQKYLDNWTNNYSNIVRFNSPTIGLAPWNISKYKISWNGEKLLVGDQKIIMYHFHNFRCKSRFHATFGLSSYVYGEYYGSAIKKLYYIYWNDLNNCGHRGDSKIARDNNKLRSRFLSLAKDFKNNPMFFKISRLIFKIDFRYPLNLVYKGLKK